MRGLDPRIPLRMAQRRQAKRDGRDRPGHDKGYVIAKSCPSHSRLSICRGFANRHFAHSFPRWSVLMRLHAEGTDARADLLVRQRSEERRDSYALAAAFDDEEIVGLRRERQER